MQHDRPVAAAAPVERSVTVAKANLTVTADGKTRAYGEANPTFTATYAGLVGSDTVTPAFSVMAAALPNTPPVYAAHWGGDGLGNGQFVRPTAIATDSAGHVYVADSQEDWTDGRVSNRVQKFAPDGTWQQTWTDLPDVVDIAVGPDNAVYVLQGGITNRLTRLAANGFTQEHRVLEAGYEPTGLTVQEGELIYVTKTVAGVMHGHVDLYRRLGGSYVLVQQVGFRDEEFWLDGGEGELRMPRDVAVITGDYASDIFVTDSHNQRVAHYREAGGWNLHGDWPGLAGVDRLVTDAAGNFYLTGVDGNNIQRRSSAGVVHYSWGADRLGALRGVAVMPDGGVVALDANGQVVRYVPAPASPVDAATLPGTYPIEVTATGERLVHYNVTLVAGTLTIVPRPAVLNWATPASIEAGVAIGAGRLNATADLPGTIAYTRDGGGVVTAASVFAEGEHILTATFTPADPTLHAVTTATVTLNVVAPTMDYAEWAEANLPAGARDPDAAQTPDNVSNRLRFALGLPAQGAVDLRRLPVATWRTVDGSFYAVLVFERPDDRAGVHYRLQVSDDLVTWHTVAAIEEVAAGGTAGYERVTLRDPQPLVRRTPRFLRLLVE